MASYMERRKFLATLGGAAVAWPLAARAQQAAIPVIGFLDAASLETEVRGLAEFRKGLSEIGYVEGQNVMIVYRSAEGQADRLPALAADMVQRRVAVIVTVANNAAVAAKATTTTIPIVFTVGGDPIKMGLVDSLNRPGGNITGVSFLSSDIIAKMLEALHELMPKAARIAALVNPTNQNAAADTKEAEAAARTLGLELQVLNASNGREIDDAFARPNPQGRETSRPAGAVGHETRASCQPQYCQGTRPRSPCNTARPRRRGNRVM